MLLDVMIEVKRETGFKTYAWVVMPDHIHLVVRLPESMTLGRVMQLIKGQFAYRYNKSTNRHERTWQSRYHGRVLRSDRALNAAIQYVHANPIVAGLVSAAEQFPWSSSRSYEE